MSNNKRHRRWMPEWLKCPAKKLSHLFCRNGRKMTTESDKFEVTIEPLSSETANIQTNMGDNGLKEAQKQLEQIFRRYFARRPEHFALLGVHSTLSARNRQRDLRHTKQFLATMIEHWEEQRQRECLENGQDGERDNELEAFMDTYFGTLYDLLSRCGHVLDKYLPQDSTVMGLPEHYIKNHRKIGHRSSNFDGQNGGTSISTIGGAGGGESVVNFDNLSCSSTVLHGTRVSDETEVKRHERQGHRQRPKSIICYF